MKPSWWIKDACLDFPCIHQPNQWICKELRRITGNVGILITLTANLRIDFNI